LRTYCIETIKQIKVNYGLSLIEFMTVVAIVVVLTSVSIPYLGSIISRYQAESSGYHMLAGLKFCRVEALKREKDITCEINAANKNVVSRVYIDNNTSNSFDTDTDKLLISSTMSNTSYLKVVPELSRWTFDKEGFPNNNQLDQVKLCVVLNNKSTHLNTIFVDPEGVIYMKDANNAPCV